VALFGLFDLAIALVLLVFLVGSVVLLLRPARAARAGRARYAWPLAVSLAGSGLFVVFNVAYFNGFGTDPVIGSPTDAQVTGIWLGNAGATLVMKPDGTFTASRLPPHVGQPTDLPGMLPGRNPPSGHGTWAIGPGDFGGSPESVIFTLACSLPGGDCANSNLTFELQAENPGPSGSPALFYYQGDPDDWSDQYAFTRQ